jgi:hypothetical protein
MEIHTLVTVTADMPLPDNLPREGWRVIGHLDRDRLTIARSGRRMEVYSNQVEAN